MMNKKRDHGSGFTLGEILVVIVILAVLATLALPRFGAQTGKGETTEAIEIMSVIRQGLLAYFDENGSYPAALANQTAIETTLRISYTPPRHGWTFATDGSGVVTATKSSGAGAGGNLTLTPEGNWSGTGDYTRDTGQYWPQLH